jgi:hypothetical protein
MSFVRESVDNDKIRFVTANHRYHRLGKCGVSYKVLLYISTHADEHAPLRVLERVTTVDADASASLDGSRVVNQGKFPFELRTF